MDSANSEAEDREEVTFPDDMPELENMTGLVDPDKPTSSMDVAREADLMVARNLRRLEIHRFEIANALANINEDDVGHVCTDGDEIEISETDEKFAKHINRINQAKQQRQRERLDPDQVIDQRLEKAASVLKSAIEKVSGGRNVQSWDYMRHNLCLNWHLWRYDREMEQRLFNPLARFRPMARSRSLREREQVAPCAPVRLVDWSLDCLAAYQEGGSFRHFTFIDPVAGHGRTLLMASHRDFRSIIGVENRGKLSEDAAMNIAQYPRTFMAQRQVELIAKDIRLITWPDQPLIIHLFNPQSADWLHQLLEDISASFAESPRQIYLVITGNNHRDTVSEFAYFQPFSPPASNLEMLTLMAPYEIDFYFCAVPSDS